MSGTAWKDEENDAIVESYFAMLVDDLAGRAYNKAEQNRAVQSLTKRARGSIEYKHQNVSAVLKGLGHAWISGYKPAFNFQQSLVDAVARRLAESSGAFDVQQQTLQEFSDVPQLWIGPPPTRRNTPAPDELEQMQAIARRFDVAARDERNRALGKAGEERIVLHERAILSQVGRSDLADRVRWTSQDDGDGAGYDIASFTPEGEPRLIEVKTTNGWERTPFHISRNELAFAEANRDSWHLVRLWNFARGPKAFEIRPPLNEHVDLTATSFQASLH